MDDVNEWSSEYNIKVLSFSDLAESPHSWDKRVLNITPVKDGANYRFRLGLQMFPMKTNETYSLIIEVYNRDYKTWERQETYVNGTGLWVKSSNTTKFQHRYGSSGDLYYTKTLVKFKKTSSSAPVFVYYTVHYDDKGGDMNTYPKDFINQVYILAYGIIGETDHVDSEVYDAHQAFEIDKTKMKMLVPLDMNTHRLLGVPNISNEGIIQIFGFVDNSKIFVTASKKPFILYKVHISYINLSTSQLFQSKQDSINIYISSTQTIKYRFTFNNFPSHVSVRINRFFDVIHFIKLSTNKNVPYEIGYNLFY